MNKTAEEQAKEIVAAYMLILGHIIASRQAKRCATEAVNRIIGITGQKYWYDVLNEIDKIKH